MLGTKFVCRQQSIVMNRFFILFIFSFAQTAFADPGDEIIKELNAKIDQLQYEFDSKDGLADGKITLRNDYLSERATDLYVNLANEVQKNVNDRDQLWMETRDQLREIKNWFLDTNIHQLGEEEYLDKFEISYFLLADINKDLVQKKLRQYPRLAVKLYSKYKDKEFADQVLKQLVSDYPDVFAGSVYMFEDHPNLSEIVDNLVKKNPIKMKRWVGTSTTMGKMLDKSTDPTTKMFTNLFYGFGRASKSYYLMDEIVKGNMTAQEADQITKDVEKFRDFLIKLSVSDSVLAYEAVDERLAEESLRVVRPVNDLHENHDYSVRFRSVRNLTPEEFYTYIVYTQEEIFTSTYNGFYERMMNKLGDKNAYVFLEEMNFNRYRTFIKMAAGYNTLESFLKEMDEQQQQKLLTKFISNLEDGTVDNSLQASVDVADTFGSISNKELKTFFKQKMEQELARVVNENNPHAIRIYSLLNGILAQSDSYSNEWMTQLVQKYDIPKINQLKYNSLLNSDGKIIEQVYFFDDDDGEASYNSFLPTFRNSNWNIQDNKTFLKITSTDKKIEVLANKPNYEFEGKDDIRKYFKETGQSPSIVIHRGHSFYVDTTINSLTPNAKLVLLGSCGGYHKLASVLDRSPEVHIISSKQIGAMGINDPMIRLLQSNLLKEKDINWPSFWETLDGQFKGNRTTSERFQDYIPPHQNLGAIFIMAYNRLKDKDEGRG